MNLSVSSLRLLVKILSVLAILSQPCLLFAQDQKLPTASVAITPEFASTPLVKEIKALIIRHYSRAKFATKGQALHFEFKTKTYLIQPADKNGQSQKEVPELGPDWGGVVGDVSLQPGKYSGSDPMPQLLKNRSFYEVVLMAPYSAKYDCHLMTKIAYPFDVPPSFTGDFKALINDFEKFL